MFAFFSIHTLSRCDATPYPYGKIQITVLNNLFARYYLGFVTVLGEENTRHANMVETANPLCIVLYDKLR